MYRTLKASEILATTDRLQKRISERFPNASLGRVAQELDEIAREAQQRCLWFNRPNVPLRIATWICVILAISALVASLFLVKADASNWSLKDLLEGLNAGIGDVVFLGAAGIFLFTLEGRIKRKRALDAINELRALAHIVDMHQLTKDPERLIRSGPSTASSPIRTMSAFELSRYFDYCSEMLSLIAKIGALYVQDVQDSAVLSAVDEVENLTLGLSRKIWHKIDILGRFHDEDPALAN